MFYFLIAAILKGVNVDLVLRDRLRSVSSLSSIANKVHNLNHLSYWALILQAAIHLS